MSSRMDAELDCVWTTLKIKYKSKN
jgi:hypothetical protein